MQAKKTDWVHLGGDLEARPDGRGYVEIRMKGKPESMLFLNVPALMKAQFLARFSTGQMDMPLELRLAMVRLNALGFWLDHLTRGKWDEAALLHGDWAGLLCPDGCAVPWPRCAEMRDEKIGNIVRNVIDEHDTNLPSEDIGRLMREALECEGLMVVAPGKTAVQP